MKSTKRNELNLIFIYNVLDDLKDSTEDKELIKDAEQIQKLLEEIQTEEDAAVIHRNLGIKDFE